MQTYQKSRRLSSLRGASPATAGENRHYPDFVCVAVAKGEVELCVHQISEIMPVAGVTLVGPLPKDVQRVTTVAVAVSARTNEAEAARALLAFVGRPEFKAAFAKAGLDYRID